MCLPLFAFAMRLYRTQGQHRGLTRRRIQSKAHGRILWRHARSRTRCSVRAPLPRQPRRRFQLRRRRSLLLRSFHLQTPIGVVPVEGFVSIGTRVGAFRDTAKSIEIKLALEGR